MIHSGEQPMEPETGFVCRGCGAKVGGLVDPGPGAGTCRHCGLRYTIPRELNPKRVFGAALLSFLFFVAAYVVGSTSGEMGYSLFLVLPAAVGAFFGYLSLLRNLFGLLVLIGVLGLAVAVLVTGEFSGVFCGLIGFFVVLIPTTVGAVIGALLAGIFDPQDPQKRRPILGILLALPAIGQAVEVSIPHPGDLASIVTEAVFDGPVDATWDAIVFYEEVEHEAPSLLRWSLPRPLRSVGDKRREGELVRCFYDRGYLLKRIREVRPHELIAFDVLEQKLHFERDVTLLGGAFELESIRGGRATRVRLRTDYERHLAPSFIWKPIEVRVVRALHGHVLEGMRANEIWKNILGDHRWLHGRDYVYL
ncbi:MAG: hypothetical protein AAF517_04170, partial [Planctomycetota bacterium]